MEFKKLTRTIATLDRSLRETAIHSVNRMLTLRNWVVGRYIVEYEQHGKDRAKYGQKLIRTLAHTLKKQGVAGMSFTNLNLFRQFYLVYPQIIKQASELLDVVDIPILKSRPGIVQKASEQWLQRAKGAEPHLLLRHFSYSHFVELVQIRDPLKRMFYEVEGIKGHWSVPQLKRQIETLLFERTGLSKDKAALLRKTHTGSTFSAIQESIRDPYVLEFTGLKEVPEYGENDLEIALLDHIQEFLMELGTGFCFEARQKRITIDNEHDRIDLVFYHRLLRCHVRVDLKIRKFKPADAGQMNFYLNYFKENIQGRGDNPPVGLILCTHRDDTRVKYATAGLDNKLFVSKYKVVLPTEMDLTKFITHNLARLQARV